MGASQGTCGFEEEGCCPWKDRLLKKDPIDQTLDELIENLFRIQDLNGDGVLDETELVQLNKKVAILHYGKDVDKEKLKTKYQDLFRSMLGPSGESVSQDAFRRYTLNVLRAQDRDKVAQSFILEQWISEAVSARYSFSIPSMQSISDVPFLLLPSFDVDPSQAHRSRDGEPIAVGEPTAVCTPPVAVSAHDEGEFLEKLHVKFGNLPMPQEDLKHSGEVLRDEFVPRAPAPSEATSSGLSKADPFSDGQTVQVTVCVRDSSTPS